MTSLQQARLYLVAPCRLAAGDLAHLVPDLAVAGVDVIQLREKEMEAGDLLRVGQPIADACAAAGLTFIVNDRPDVALALGAGVHVGTDDLPVGIARRVVGDRIIGTSNHSAADIARSLDAAPDYMAVGPVFETPTKPGRPAVGLDLVRHAAAVVPTEMPWFAIGGIDLGNVETVLEAGASRVVVVRAITEAADPLRAAAALKSALSPADP